MSEVSANFVKARRRAGKGEQQRSPGEQKALDTMRREADRWGVTLENDGEGGLPSSLVLRVMRRDKYRCKRHGGRDKPLTVHHKGGIIESKWLDTKGHQNDPNNIVTLCTDCHDDIHEKARKEGVDSSQKTAAGDKGDPKHDPEAR
jgi:5-methylcytosine-specific restriction endonuclease McrA